MLPWRSILLSGGAKCSHGSKMLPGEQNAPGIAKCIAKCSQGSILLSRGSMLLSKGSILLPGEHFAMEHFAPLREQFASPFGNNPNLPKSYPKP